MLLAHFATRSRVLMSSHFDIAVVGAGIAGVSIAAHLAEHSRVVVLEQEGHPGYHTTGRSAALFSETYGSPTIRLLSRASRSFFMEPPEGFTETPLLKKRGELLIAAEAQMPILEKIWANPEFSGLLRRLNPHEAKAICPILSETYVASALYDPGTYDIDVHALHYGYIKLFLARGGILANDSPVRAATKAKDGWHLQCGLKAFTAKIIVNAAGSWADEVAAMAGAAPIHISAKRRTAALIEAPAGSHIDDWPIVADIEENFYFKPDAGLLMLSPCDETEMAPCDVQPDELDVAIAIDRVEKATTLSVRNVRRKWAGLRNFAPDREPVVGYDDAQTGFFWLAGQGGYGLQTAPALSRLASALLLDKPIANDTHDLTGLTATISPQRPSLAR